MAQNYWEWPETEWSAGADHVKAGRITAGVDVGTTSAQAAILCGGKVIAYANIRTGADFDADAQKVLEQALAAAGLTAADLNGGIGATGWGAAHVKGAAKEIDEITCHAKGARLMFGPDVHTVVDMGGQTIKAIRLYDWDRVRDFAINDKCFMGAGRNLETVCELLEVPLTELGALSLEVEKEPEPVSTTCYAFAQAETLGLFGRPELKAKPLSLTEVYASHVFAAAWRILGVIGRLQPLDVGDITCEKDLAFTGGLAKNIGITTRIEKELKITAVKSDLDPQIAGAVGAALLV